MMTREEARTILEEVRAIDDSMYQYNQAYLEALDMAIAALKAEPKWIPVDYDRYPETYPRAFQEVWMTDLYGEVRHIAYDGRRNIKAWMPYVLPEPYKEGESE